MTGSPTPRQFGHTDDAPAPAGPYSQATRIGNLVQSAGQVGRLPDGTLVDGVGEQTRQALRNVIAALGSCGAGIDEVISIRVYLTDANDFDAMNSAYADVLSEPYPSRTTVYVGLRAGALVEIEALAVIG